MNTSNIMREARQQAVYRKLYAIKHGNRAVFEIVNN